MSEFCTQCGNDVEADDRFCRKCGAAISRVSGLGDVEASATEKGRLGRPAVAVIGFGLLLAVALVTFVVSRSREAGSPVTSSATTPVLADLNGTWEGSYRYASGTPPPVTFTFAASFDGSRISGTVMEPHTIGSAAPPRQTATVQGRLDGTSVRVSKRYSTGAVVEYEGTLDPATRTIQGNWRSANASMRGTYQMRWRTQERLVVAAVAPPPDPMSGVVGTWIQRGRESIAGRTVTTVMRIQQNGPSFLLTFATDHPYGGVRGTYPATLQNGILHNSDLGDIAYSRSDGVIFIRGTPFFRSTDPRAEAQRLQLEPQSGTRDMGMDTNMTR